MNTRRETRAFWLAWLALALTVALFAAWFLLMLAIARTVTV